MMLLLAIASLVSWMDEMPDHLPGSDMSVAQAEKQALYIIEARLLHLGERREADGGLAYPQAIIEPSKVLKGGATARALRRVVLALKENEAAPDEGEVYVLYVWKANRAFEVFKVTQRPKGNAR